MSTPLCIVIGTRAQLIKTAPVMRALQDRDLPYRFVYTAQHKDTMQEILDEFGVKPPDYTLLNLETEAKNIFLFVSWFLRAFAKLFLKRREIVPFKNGLVLIHGDTASALWGAVLGKVTGNRVFHLESGLRSFDIFNPFPEELLRIINFWLSDVYTPPGDWALNNLKRHRGPKINTHHNTLLDSLRHGLDDGNVVKLYDPPYVVTSVKRVENLYNAQRLEQIMRLTLQIAEKHRVIQMIHPVSRSRLEKTPWLERLEQHPNITLQNRLSYLKFINLLARAEYIVMDSGSSQEELSYVGVPVLLMRKATERTEGLDHNVVLSKFDPAIIDDFITNYDRYRFDPDIPNVSPTSIVVDWLEAEIGQPATEPV